MMSMERHTKLWVCREGKNYEFVKERFKIMSLQRVTKFNFWLITLNLYCKKNIAYIFEIYVEHMFENYIVEGIKYFRT